MAAFTKGSCAGRKFECVLSTHSPPDRHYSIGKRMRFALLRQMHFSPSPKVFVCSIINATVIYLEGGLENLRKRTEIRENSFSKT